MKFGTFDQPQPLHRLARTRTRAVIAQAYESDHSARPDSAIAAGEGRCFRSGLPRRIAICAALSIAAIFAMPRAVPADSMGVRASQTQLNLQDVTATVVMPQAQAAPGQRIPVAIDFDIAPGWHIYGAPLPEDYTPTTVKFDSGIVARQAIDFPKPRQVNFKAIGETLPVYTGKFKVNGAIWLKPGLAPGNHKLPGEISFQECNDFECKPPQRAQFEIPITVAQ